MSLYRRLVLLSCLSWPLAGFSATALTNLVAEPFAKLEQDFGGSIGVYAMDTGSGATVSYRAEERFPLCSSFKGFLAAAVLARSQQQAGLLDTPIRYGKNALVPWSPISEKYLTTGMTVAELSAAAVQYSDNAAANLLLKELGGPAGLTAFMRSIGDTTFRLDRCGAGAELRHPRRCARYLIAARRDGKLTKTDTGLCTGCAAAAAVC